MGDGLIEELRRAIGADHVLSSPADMEPFNTDWRGRYTGRARCVARPGSTEEVASVVRLCAAHAAPIVPQGGNTGLVGGGTPDASGDAVLVSLARMNHVRSIDPSNSTVVAESGCVLASVQQAAESVDRLFPLSLAAEGSCSIGGNLSTNAGGVHVLRYGSMRDLVLGLEVVLPDGRVWDGLRALRKDNTGYDLKHLFIGAEGTLGIITAAVLKLFPRPRQRAVAWLGLDRADDAVGMLGRFRARFGERVTAFELIGRPALELVLQHLPGARDPLGARFDWQLLVELADTDDRADLGALLEDALGRELEEGRIGDAAIARSLSEIGELWRLRESISEAQRIEGISIKHDISVPVSRIPEFLRRADAELAARFGSVRIVAFGHIGDGNLHYNLSRPPGLDNAAFIAQTPEANRIVHDLVAALGGSISAEHGLGQLKREEIRRYKSELELELMRSIKRTLDPAGLMNPGKLL